MIPFLLLTAFVICKTDDNCPYDGWKTHELEIYQTYGYSLINGTTPGLYINESKYGVEGGQVLLVNDVFYLFITEFIGDPRWVPSKLALWSTNMNEFPFGWKRLETLYESNGIENCNPNNTRDSLGSSITAIFDESKDKWLIYYVGFESCGNDTYFYNRNGNIYLAESSVNGMDGIKGPYNDVDIILKPDSNSQYWEGLQGVDSLSNPFYIDSLNEYYAFYGSANTQNKPNITHYVGLASATSLYGPWNRVNGNINPVSMFEPNNIEQPIVTQFYDGSYGAVSDALSQENKGDIGYTWSPNGIDWNPSCSQYLTVNPPNAIHWGTARTPQGIVPINNTHFWIFFSGYDNIGATYHESFGVVKARFIQS